MKAVERWKMRASPWLLASGLLGSTLAVFLPVAIRAYQVVQARQAATGAPLTDAVMARTLGVAIGLVGVGAVKTVALMLSFSLGLHGALWLGRRVSAAYGDLKRHWEDGTGAAGEGPS